MSLPQVYYCKRCNRYTDVHYALDKGLSNRKKSMCYKCGEEMLEAVGICIKY